MSHGVPMHILKPEATPRGYHHQHRLRQWFPIPAPKRSMWFAGRRLGYARAFRFEVAEDVMLKEVMAQLKCSLGAGTLKSLLRKVFAFPEDAIFVASVLSTVARAHPDPEGGVALVDLGPLSYCALFTEAYRNPATLADFANAKAKDICARHLKKSGSSNNIAVVAGWKTCKTYMAISLLIGVVVGVLCHKGNLGAARGGGLLFCLELSRRFLRCSGSESV